MHATKRSGIVVLVVSDSCESAHLPSLEAVHNKLKYRLLDFGGYFSG